METLEFAPGLRLGIDLIDEQHRRFYEIMNNLIAADLEADQRDLVCGILNELAEYVAEHFSTEEELMARFEYPDRAAHQLQHVHFAAQVEDFHRKYERSEIGLEDEIMAYMVDWFTRHVRQEDPKYVELFKANGV